MPVRLPIRSIADPTALAQIDFVWTKTFIGVVLSIEKWRDNYARKMTNSFARRATLGLYFYEKLI